MPPLYTDGGYNTHTPAEMRIDCFQVDRWADGGDSKSPRGFYEL